MEARIFATIFFCLIIDLQMTILSLVKTKI